MDPKLEEFTRASDLSNLRFLRSLQEYVRTTIQPQLDERDRLLVEIQELRDELAGFKANKRQRADKDAA